MRKTAVLLSAIALAASTGFAQAQTTGAGLIVLDKIFPR